MNSPSEPGLAYSHQFNSLEITGAIQSLQNSVNSQFANVCSKLQAIDGCIALLETKHKTHVRSSPSSQASISPALTGSGKRRRRVTPSGLQVWYVCFSNAATGYPCLSYILEQSTIDAYFI